MRDIELEAIKPDLIERSGGICELCGGNDTLEVYEVPPVVEVSADKSVLLCSVCTEQLGQEVLDGKHWLCLNDTAWSQIPAVQVMAWRLLGRLTGESWAQDLQDQMYLEEDAQKWAEDTGSDSVISVVDSNGAQLSEGDTVTIIKDLDVKGTSFVAKRGTVVKSIHLGSNPELVEGKVNGTTIFLKTCFLKKS